MILVPCSFSWPSLSVRHFTPDCQAKSPDYGQWLPAVSWNASLSMGWCLKQYGLILSNLCLFPQSHTGILMDWRLERKERTHRDIWTRWDQAGSGYNAVGNIVKTWNLWSTTLCLMFDPLTHVKDDALFFFQVERRHVMARVVQRRVTSRHLTK